MLETLSIIRNHGTETRQTLGADFPSLRIELEEEGGEAHVLRSEWEKPQFDTWQFDCFVDPLSRLTIDDDGAGPSTFPLEVLNRCQRLLDRRNEHSATDDFDRVRRVHAAFHDLSLPLVRADYNHAVDVWQWLLRLDGAASLELQLAALFHDIERLVSEPDHRIEHLASDYQAFKNSHASAGAQMTEQILRDAGIATEVRERTAAIVAAHEEPSIDPEVALLNDADALSFFSLNSSGYADYFGPEQTKKKVAYTLNRLRGEAKTKLAGVRLRPEIAKMVNVR